MSKTLDLIKELVALGKIEVSRHGYRMLAERGITVSEIVSGAPNSTEVEDYPDYFAGPCVLVLQFDESGKPIHVLWGVPRGHAEPAMIVTAYRPHVDQWSGGFRKRRER
jgi:hypothetical protein